MLSVLNSEQVVDIRARQKALYEDALRSTLEAFPGTDPMALITFTIKLGHDYGLITSEDIEWAVQNLKS